jgi:hypothetical protein
MIKYSCTKERFHKDIKGHAMKILQDDGVYRHLSFSNNGSSVYKFDLVTWPGHLCVCGDMGEYLFSRVNDMFEFFKGDDISPCYWSEKLQASMNGYEQFSPEKADKIVDELFEEYKKNQDEEIPKDELDDMMYGISNICVDGDEINLIADCDNFDDSYDVNVFENVREYDFKEFTFRYIWILYSIVHGIKCYNDEKTI